MQDRVLVLNVGDGDPDGSEVVALLPEVRQELPDVAPPWALHVHEGLVEIHLHEVGLRSEDATESILLLLSGSVLLNVQDDFVGEALTHEIPCDIVFVVPMMGSLLFHVCRVFWVLQDGMRVRTIKVALAAIDCHHSLELPDKYSPVAAFRVEVQDFGG